MRLEPARPAPERPPTAVDGVHADALVAEERGLDEDEAEARAERRVREEGAHLGAEDGGVYAAAVEAEDAREGEGGGLVGGCGAGGVGRG